MKLKEILNLNENSTYFIRIMFYIDYGWYNNPTEIVNSMFKFQKDIIKRADIEFLGNKPENNPKNSVFLIKVLTTLSKPEMEKWLKNNTTRSENFKIL
jgi:hypothetical protein